MKRFLSAVFLLFPSGSAWSTSNLNQAADDVCKCLEEPYAQVEKALEMVAAAQASGDMSALAEAQGEMMGVIGASGQCFERLGKKYPKINESQDLQQKVMRMADEKCPNPASKMGMGR